MWHRHAGESNTLFTPDEVTMEKFTPDKADKGLHQRRVYTRHRLHQTPSIHQTRFTPDVVYTRQGQQRFTPERVYSRDSLHQTAFTPDTVYTRQKGLTADEVYTRQNRQRFTPERVYSRDSLHQTAFTPDTVYTRRRLHQTKPTKVYTRKSLHHRQFTPDSVYTRHRLHQTWFTPDMVETIAAAIIRRLATKDCKTPRNYALNDDTGTPSSQNYKANSNQSV